MDAISQVFRADVGRFNAPGLKHDKGDIAIKKGYQFVMLNHWSLYESMRNSDYLMTKLRLWEDKGLNRLHEFIHAIGISLQEAKQLYKFMSSDSQKNLEHNIIPAAEKLDLLDVTFISFMKQADYSATYMASDYYYILTSILEAPPQQEIPFNELPEYRVQCFWEAYDAFDGTLHRLDEQIDKNKYTTKVMMTEAKRLLERDHLISMKVVSVANIRSDTEDRKLFEHPAVLVRMAYLLMGILREKEKIMKHRQKSYSKPFIANWIDLKKEICVVAGVMMEGKSKIGVRFAEIADKLKMDMSHDSFMANIMVIKKDSLSEFLKELNELRE